METLYYRHIVSTEKCYKLITNISPFHRKVEKVQSVKSKSTNDLSEELMQESNIDAYINGNRQFLSDQSISELLTELYEKKSISKAALARKAGISEVYLH